MEMQQYLGSGKIFPAPFFSKQQTTNNKQQTISNKQQ
jgi:hypothetical protein